MTKTKTREKEVFTNIVILFHHKNYPLTQNFWQKDFGHSFEKYILCMVNLTQTLPRVTFKEAEKSYQSDRLSLEKFFPHFFVYLRRF